MKGGLKKEVKEEDWSVFYKRLVCVCFLPDLTFAFCPGVQVTFQMQIQTRFTTESTHTQ